MNLVKLFFFLCCFSIMNKALASDLVSTLVVADPKCSICLESCSPQTAKTLSCGHSFHPECIHSWLKGSQTCPNCRRLIKSPQHCLCCRRDPKYFISICLSSSLIVGLVVSIGVLFANGDCCNTSST